MTEGTDNVPHIYATTNAFTSVLELAKPIDVDEGIPEDDFARYQDFYNLMIEVDPTDDAILYVGGIDLFRTTQRVPMRMRVQIGNRFRNGQITTF